MERVGRSYLPIAIEEHQYRRIVQFEQAGLAFFDADKRVIKLTAAGHAALEATPE
jgi:hypothetical protein